MENRNDRARNPVIASPNRLKLAVFGLNVSSGCAMTSAAGTLRIEWCESIRLAQAAEAAGFEAIIPVARWRGFGGATNFNHRSFETMTWAAGLAAATERIGIFATVHTPTVHPVRAAKEAATIDHISAGRLTLNLVAGWNAEEIRMFGTPQMEHDDRYALADEWLALAKRLWTEGSFDFKGRFFDAPAAYSEPKPIQSPWPAIMSAGVSPAGRDFAARQADLNFAIGLDVAAVGATAKAVKQLARERYAREVSVFAMAYVVCRPTEAEARRYYDYYVYEKGDVAAARNLLATFIPNSRSAPAGQLDAMIDHFIAGYGGLPLIGTPAQVVEEMGKIAAAGVDGLTLCWVDYDEGIAQYREELRPRLIESGLRES
ncbi:MAG TPA: LLM class flavin-dependent oxidoreductase [Candidatus Binataceae bacterium]|nr:LLM class flavin-dependent oxidoreductase [Candidatus Binataceae bacterium]